VPEKDAALLSGCVALDERLHLSLAVYFLYDPTEGCSGHGCAIASIIVVSRVAIAQWKTSPDPSKVIHECVSIGATI
jgi:hypothetical protein